MLKKYQSKNANANKITRTVTIYRIEWKAMKKDTFEVVTKFKDMNCKVDNNDLLKLVSSFYADGETDTSVFPMVSTNEDVTVWEISDSYEMTVAEFIRHAKKTGTHKEEYTDGTADEE